MAHQWHPIEDLGDSFAESVHDELHHLAEVWQEQKHSFDPAQLQKFDNELKREWAIETGLIERIYTVNRGVTESLIKLGIRADLIPHENGNSPGKIAAMMSDHENVIDGLFDFVKNERELSVGYIKELHAALTYNQETTEAIDQFGKVTKIPLLHGAFKIVPNNPRTSEKELHEYCPPEHVASEMDRLIDMYQEHNQRKVPPLAAAAWLHHRFTQIHPFQDGNGRVARCLATLIFIKADWFPLVIHNEGRERYLDTLGQADAGDLSPLIHLFAAVQKKYIVAAMGIAKEVAQEDSAAALIKSAVYKIKKEQGVSEEYEPAKIIANEMLGVAKKCLRKIGQQIRTEFGSEDRVSILSSTKKSEFIDGVDRVAVAKKYNYDINIDVYCGYACAYMQEERFDLTVCFTGIGKEYRGIIAGYAYIRTVNYTSQSKVFSSPKILNHELFQINYKESLPQTQKRFEKWLDDSILNGLRIWRDNL